MYIVHCLLIAAEQLPAGKKPSGKIRMACKCYGWTMKEAPRRRVTVTSSLYGSAGKKEGG